MKKIMLKLAVLLAVSALSTAAFAEILLEPGTIFSIGTLTPATFKTSPKVTINVSGTVDTLETTWGAVAGHASALNKSKGMHYYTNNSDPGMWFDVEPATAVADYTVEADAAPTNFEVEK